MIHPRLTWSALQDFLADRISTDEFEALLDDLLRDQHAVRLGDAVYAMDRAELLELVAIANPRFESLAEPMSPEALVDFAEMLARAGHFRNRPEQAFLATLTDVRTNAQPEVH